MCCKLLGIGELKKPRNKWCPHCAIGSGCRIYEQRPESCQTFECFWLQDEGKYLSDEARPDKTGVVIFMPDEVAVQVHVDPHKPDAWRTGETGTFIQGVSGGIRVLVTIGERRKAIGTPELLKDTLIKIGEDLV